MTNKRLRLGNPPFLIVLVLVGLLAPLSFLFRSDPAAVAGRPLTEDSYYSFSVARNIALGNGITIDGKTPTNGFQPLFTFLTVPAFAISGSDQTLPLRIILFIHWLFFLGTGYLLSRIVYDFFEGSSIAFRQLGFWLTFLVTVTSVSIFLFSFNGLETGCLLFFYSLTWRYYQKTEFTTISSFLYLGILLGLTVLVRVDAVFFTMALALMIWEPWTKRESLRRLYRAVLVGACAFIVSSPWWFYNLFVFGSIMPTSGKAQQEWMFSFDRILSGVSSLGQSLVPSVYLGTTMYEGVFAGVIRLGLLIIIIFGLLKFRNIFFNQQQFDERIVFLHRRTWRFGIVVLIAGFLLSVWYVFSSFAYWFYPRYFSFLLIVGVVITGSFLTILSNKLPRLVKILSSILCFPLLAAVFLIHIGKTTNEYYIDQLQLINAYVPPSELVGAFQSGTLGYYRPNIVNLDGKVNSLALNVLKSGKMQSSYIHEKKIRWLCDWEWKISPYLKDSNEDGQWKKIGVKGDFILYHFDGD